MTNLLTRSSEAMIANFYAADPIAQRQFRAAVVDHAEGVVRVTKVYAAVDTGFMRDHTRYTLSPSGLISEQGWFMDDFASAGLDFYPPYVEFGTSRMAAQPALLPAANVMAPQFEARLSAIVAATLRRTMRGRRA
jgi:hypothetical protein